MEYNLILSEWYKNVTVCRQAFLAAELLRENEAVTGIDT